MEAQTTHDLRCICPKLTKLGMYGVTDDGKPYVHVKVFKQGRVYGEMFTTSGDVRLRCRDCGRWTRVNILRRDFGVESDVRPPQIPA